MTAEVANFPDQPTDDTRFLTKRAADELLAEGVRPTVASIRARIKRGSAGTINEALREWWEELSRRLVAARARPDLPQPVADAANQLWGAALENADKALAERRVEVDQELAKAAQAVSTALLARTEAEKALEELKQEHQILKEARLALERQVSVETERRQVAESAIQTAQTDAERRIAELRERMHELEGLLGRERARADSSEERLLRQVDEHKTAHAKAEAKYSKDAAAWHAEKSKLLDATQQLHQRVAEIQGRNAALDERLVSLDDERSTLRHQYETLLAEKTQIQTRSAQSQAIEEGLRRELATLQQALQVIERDREVLRHDLLIARKALKERSSSSEPA